MSRIADMDLRARLTFLIALAVVSTAFISFAGWQSYRATENATFKEFNKRQLVIAKSASAGMGSVLQAAAVEMGEIAESPAVRNDNETEARALLKQKLADLAQFGVIDIGIEDAAGSLKYTAADRRSEGGNFEKPAGKANDYRLELINIEGTDNKGVILSAPILENGRMGTKDRFVGTIFTAIDLGAFTEKFVAPIKTPGEESLFLIDEQSEQNLFEGELTAYAPIDFGHNTLSIGVSTSRDNARKLLQTAIKRQLGLLASMIFIIFFGSAVAVDATNRVSILLEKQVTEKTRELVENQESQTIISRLLSLSLEDIPLDELLMRALELVLSLPWIAFTHRGAIFLVDKDEPGFLVMMAQRGLAKTLEEKCARIPFGLCYCGQAAETKTIQFADKVDDRHKITYSHMRDHGHYSVPIIFKGEVLGVLNIYLEAGHPRNDREDEYLNAVANTLAGLIQRKKAEEALSRQAAELARSNADLEQFAYVASHDLQEPLRMVSSYVQLLARRYKGRLDSDADEFIDFAVDGASRMKILIDDLLTFSRVSPDKSKLVEVDCEDVYETVLSDLESSIKDNNAIITHDPLPTLTADASQLAQLLRNLISNAIKFHGPKQPKIHISTRRDNHAWLFSVIDNGIGIDPQFSERVFMLFQRLHHRETYPGTGIGLAICKKIVERHGGRIWVESEPDKGSVFSFTIPDEAP